jgi:hypothetical protein
MRVDNQQNGLARSRRDTVHEMLPENSQGQKSTLIITDLLHMSRELSEALTPASPGDAFRAGLHDELVLAARRRHAQRILAGDFADTGSLAASQGNTRLAGVYGSSRRMVWGAAAVGLGSAVSVISVMAAYYWRRRGRRPEGAELETTVDEARKAA